MPTASREHRSPRLALALTLSTLLAATVTACSGRAPSAIPTDTATASSPSSARTQAEPTTVGDTDPSAANLDDPAAPDAVAASAVADYLGWAASNGSICEGTSCTFERDGISFVVGVESRDGATIERVSLVASPIEGTALDPAASPVITRTFASMLAPLVGPDTTSLDAAITARLAAPGTSIDLNDGFRLVVPRPASGVDGGATKLLDLVASDLPEAGDSIFASGASTLLEAYALQGFDCADPVADTRVGFLVTSCQVERDGLEFGISVITDPTGALAAGTAWVVDDTGNDLDVDAALPHLADFTRSAVGPGLETDAVSWLTQKLGTVFVGRELTDDLTIATFDGANDDRSQLFVEVATRSYAEPAVSGSEPAQP